MTDDMRAHLDTMPTEELVRILREHDLEEWRPEVFPAIEVILQERGVDTRAVQAAAPEHDDAAESGALETVATFGGAAEANVCMMALREAGIEACLSNRDVAGQLPVLGWAAGVDVLVRPEQAQSARDLLAQFEADATPIAVEPGPCPRCASVDTGFPGPTDQPDPEPGRASMEASRPPAERRWGCRSCGHEWSSKRSGRSGAEVPS
ncbi:MAG: putative signal transducing protein [Candidatus Polarisedimenticolia bacterium]